MIKYFGKYRNYIKRYKPKNKITDEEKEAFINEEISQIYEDSNKNKLIELFDIINDKDNKYFQLIKKIVINYKYKGKESFNNRMFWYLVLATIPGALLGFLLDDVVENVFRQKIWLIATALAVMGVLIFLGDKCADKHYKIETDFKHITLKSLKKHKIIVKLSYY